MATHSSVLAWRVPGTGEPGGLPSMGSHRVRHDWSNLAAVAAAAYRSKPKFKPVTPQGCEIETLRITNHGQPTRLYFLSCHQLNTVISLLCFCTVSEVLPWLLWWSTPDHAFLVWHCLIWVDLFSNKLLRSFDLPQFIFQLLGHNEKKQIGLTKGVDYDKVSILLDREQGFLLHTRHDHFP